MQHFQVYGALINETLEKCIDHPSEIQVIQRQGTSKAVGEAGRQAEAMAFGEVINLYLSMSYAKLASTGPEGPELVVSDLDQTPAAEYKISPDVIEQLFDRQQPSANINLPALRSERNLPVPYSRGTAGKAISDPTSSIPPPRSPPITEEVQAKMEEFRSRFDALKSRCVVRHDDD